MDRRARRSLAPRIKRGKLLCVWTPALHTCRAVPHVPSNKIFLDNAYLRVSEAERKVRVSKMGVRVCQFHGKKQHINIKNVFSYGKASRERLFIFSHTQHTHFTYSYSAFSLTDAEVGIIKTYFITGHMRHACSVHTHSGLPRLISSVAMKRI